MKYLIILVSILLLLAGCTTTDVNTVAKPKLEEPALLKVGMSAADIQSLLGEPKSKTSKKLSNGETVETWIYNTLVKEWNTIQQTDFEIVEKLNLITREVEEEVVPIESNVRRTLHQEITVKIHNGVVVGLDSKMIEDVDEVI